MRQWKIVEVQGSVFIPFDWKDPDTSGASLGRAEFQVCLKFRRGKVSEFWVYPVQTHLDTAWHYAGGGYGDFAIGAYEGLVSEGAWFVNWCSEHKCPDLYVYAPKGAKVLEISSSGLTFWKSDFSKEKGKLVRLTAPVAGDTEIGGEVSRRLERRGS